MLKWPLRSYYFHDVSRCRADFWRVQQEAEFDCDKLDVKVGGVREGGLKEWGCETLCE